MTQTLSESTARLNLRRLIPRPETTLLLIGLVWTLWAKWVVVLRHRPEHRLAAWLDVVLWDIVFFAAIGLLFSLLYLTRQFGVVARVVSLLGAIVLGWSVLNCAWLIATGVQLQPGVVLVVLRSPSEFAPVITGHLSHHLVYATAFVMTLIAALAWFIWRLILPTQPPRHTRALLMRSLGPGAVLASSLLFSLLVEPWAAGSYPTEVLSFSSHWYAIVDTVHGATATADVKGTVRYLPRAGEQKVSAPNLAPDQLPNVVLLFLESVSYDATSLHKLDRDTTPKLVALAGEGAEFVSTHVPVPLTDKAFWSAMTGTVPDLQSDYGEAVLADEPYEGLPSLLARCGYRSAFFEMSKGSFECAPGFFANLAFDWAWFRENLEDRSAYLGPLGGDDFRAIAPAFKWVDQGTGPFLLGMITTVAHEPYVVPAWFAEPKNTTYERYLQAVQFSDAFVAEVDRQLEQRNLKKNTILCVIGDHGESFRPEVRTSRWAPFEEAIRVPWVMRWAGHIPAGTRIEWPCSQLDVLPTILSLIGFDLSEAKLDGRNALTPAKPNRRLYFAGWYPASPRGYLEGHRKVVYWPYHDKVFEYHLEKDPQERSLLEITGPEKKKIINDVENWRADGQFHILAKRFRKRKLYRYWQAFSSGRRAWAYYVPDE